MLFAGLLLCFVVGDCFGLGYWLGCMVVFGLGLFVSLVVLVCLLFVFGCLL